MGFTITFTKCFSHWGYKFNLMSLLSHIILLSQLCIDTCRKCETVFPVTSWLPCPPLLNIPDCTSPNLSWMVSIFCNSWSFMVILPSPKGSLPLACYPDIGPFGNIMPLNSISAVSKVGLFRFYQNYFFVSLFAILGRFTQLNSPVIWDAAPPADGKERRSSGQRGSRAVISSNDHVSTCHNHQ